jgi:hypothetical protein
MIYSELLLYNLCILYRMLINKLILKHTEYSRIENGSIVINV